MRALALAFLLAPLAHAQPPAVVVAHGRIFEPQTLVVDPGASVTVEAEGEAHTLTSVDGRFDTGIVVEGANATFAAPASPGEYRFYCKLHANATDPLDASHMTGVLVVRGAPPAKTPGAGAAPLAALLALVALGRRR